MKTIEEVMKTIEEVMKTIEEVEYCCQCAVFSTRLKLLENKLDELEIERDRWKQDSMQKAATITNLVSEREYRNEIDKIRERFYQEDIEKLQAEHVSEPVGETVGLPGSSGGFSTCVFKSVDVPIGSKLFLAPQPPATQDGRVLAPKRPSVETVAAACLAYKAEGITPSRAITTLPSGYVLFGRVKQISEV